MSTTSATEKVPEIREDLLCLRTVKSILVNNPTVQALAEAEITEDHFLGATAKDQFKWLVSYRATHGSWPSEAAFESTFVQLPSAAAEPLTYLSEELNNRKKSIELTAVLKRAAEQLDLRKPDAAMLELSTILTSKTYQPKKKILSFKEGIPNRTAEYDAVKAAGGPKYLKTPWPTLDGKIQMSNGSFVVVLAPANTGKSWLACILANYWMQEGKKVLFITMEMAAARMMLRLDSLRYKVPFGKLRDSNLDPPEETSWKTQSAADFTALVGDILVYDKLLVRTVFDVFSLVQRHSPDAVVIDGGYRFEPENKKSAGWEASSKIVGDIQLYAELSGVPWVVTTQYQLEDKKAVKPGEHPLQVAGVKYAKEWIINPDTVIGMWASEFDRAMKKMLLVVMKCRDHDGIASDSQIPINWNLEDMNFTELMHSFPATPSTGKPPPVFDPNLSDLGIDAPDFGDL